MTDIVIAQLVDRFMRRIHVELQARAPEFDPDRIGPSASMILMALADLEPIAANELARRVARDKSQMTRVLKSLAEKGLIERCACEGDARVSLVALTLDGRGYVTEVKKVLTEIIDGILAPLAPDERGGLTAILSKVSA